jgi:signal transduction histidine kinase
MSTDRPGTGQRSPAEASAGTSPSLRQEERLAAIGLLACGVVHDFANLLTVLQGHRQLLQLESDPDAQREHLASMDYVIQQCNELCNSLLTFARQQEPPPQPVYLRAIAQEVLRVLRRTVGAHLTLELEASADLPPVQADPTQLTQVVLNLCLNACAAVTGTGRLHVQLDTVAQPPRPSGLQTPGVSAGTPPQPSRLFIRLRVSDTGSGIDPAVREQIFQPFFTTGPSAQGTGLGLTIVADITARHGGWVDCQSAVGQGTCFTVYLPAVA